VLGWALLQSIEVCCERCCAHIEEGDTLACCPGLKALFGENHLRATVGGKVLLQGDSTAPFSTDVCRVWLQWQVSLVWAGGLTVYFCGGLTELADHITELFGCTANYCRERLVRN
jgi:hypothetical protein